MLIQSIQKKRALCKLISATFLANSVGLPTTFAAEAVSVENTATGTASKADTKTDTVKTGAATAETKTDTTADASKADTKADASKTDTKADASKAETKTDAKASTEKKSGIGAMKDPSWAFKEDGKTPLTADELKARNYKNYYSNDEIKQIQEYLNWYGYDWLINHGYNLSVSKRASDGSSYIVIPHQEVQANSTTDNSGTSEADSKTAVSCGSGYEMVNGSCVVKCAAYETRNAETKLCETKTCDGGKVLNQKTGVCEAPVCPTELTYVEGKGCQGSGDVFSCPEGTDFDSDKKACIASCAEGTTRDKDGICKAAKKDETASSTCQLAYQEWNATDKKCEDKVCAAGQVLDKDSGKCIDKVTCPVGQVKNDNGVCAANDCTKEGKVTWTQSDGTQVCKDKCTTGQVRNKNTGECDTLGKTQITSCPSNTIKNTAEAKCDVCPDGQKPNDDQTACVDDGTKKSNDGGSKGSSKSKLAKLGGLAALAGLFLANKHHKPIVDPGVKKDDQEAGNTGKGKGSVSGKYHYKNDLPDISIKLEDEKGTPTSTFLLGAAPYYATINVGKLKDPDEKIVSMAASIGSVQNANQSFSYTSPSHKFNNGEKFALIADGNPLRFAGRYYIYVHMESVSKDGTKNIRSARAEVDVVEQGGTLNVADGNDFKGKTELVEQATAYNYGLTGSKIVSARWDGQSCHIVVNGGTVVGEGQSDTLGENVEVLSDKMDQKSCEAANVPGKDISFSKLTIDVDSKAFYDEGMVEIPGISSSGDQIAGLDDAQKKEYLNALHRQAAENDVQFYDDIPFGRKSDGTWVDYSGMPLTDKAKEAYGLNQEFTVAQRDDGSYELQKADGTQFAMSQEEYGKILLNSYKNGDVGNGYGTDNQLDPNGGSSFALSTYLKNQAFKVLNKENNGIVNKMIDTLFPDSGVVSEATLADDGIDEANGKDDTSKKASQKGNTETGLEKTGKELFGLAKDVAGGTAPSKVSKEIKNNEAPATHPNAKPQSKTSQSTSQPVPSSEVDSAQIKAYAKDSDASQTIEIKNNTNFSNPAQNRAMTHTEAVREARKTGAELCSKISLGNDEKCVTYFSVDNEANTATIAVKKVKAN